MLTIYNLKQNENLKNEILYDANFVNSDVKLDKIININYNQIQLNETIMEIKRKLLYNRNDELIKNYILHIDEEELYYIKDLYFDLAFPFDVNNKENKLKVIVRFLNEIFEKIFKQTFIKKNIKVSNSVYYKKALESIDDLNLTINQKNTLYIIPESKIFKKQINLTSNLFLSEIEPKKQFIKESINNYIKNKHIELVRVTIEDLYDKIRKMSLGDSLIYKLNILNSKKIQYTLDYLTTIFKKVYLINSITTNVIKEDFFIICVEKTNEIYLNDVPKISHLYISENYSYINQLLYLMKIYRKRLINIFIAIDNYYIDSNKITKEYEKFDIYFKELLKYDYYKLHLKRIGYFLK